MFLDQRGDIAVFSLVLGRIGVWYERKRLFRARLLGRFGHKTGRMDVDPLFSGLADMFLPGQLALRKRRLADEHRVATADVARFHTYQRAGCEIEGDRAIDARALHQVPSAPEADVCWIVCGRVKA